MTGARVEGPPYIRPRPSLSRGCGPPGAQLAWAAAALEDAVAMPELTLIAFDADDLSVISAHLQDAVLKVGDVAYLPREKRFAAVGNRFDWAEAIGDGKRRSSLYARRQS